MCEIKENDIIQLSGIYKKYCLKYSDIVENSMKKTKTGRFCAKLFLKNGKSTDKICWLSYSIFRLKEIKPYTLKFNPEKLI